MGKAKGKGKKGGGGGGRDPAKIIEDKTFGLKNKNKSKKVQRYVQQVQNQVGGGQGKYMSEAQQKAQAARRKAEKEAKRQAEIEMFKLLGDSYKPKTKKKKKKEKAKEKEAAEAEEQKKKEENEKDFGVPIVPLNHVFQQGSKASVERICVVLEHKDNLITKTKDGQDSIFLKITDGSTLNPMSMQIIGETPTSFEPKVGNVLDIRNITAMVRGEKVFLEFQKGGETTIEVASERLTEHVINLKEENDEIRAKGGIPIEELIEEQRAQLSFDKLTPVTEERFLAWKKAKKAKKEAEWEDKRKAAVKKSGGKGLNVLSGRALFAYDSSLFKDDEAALDDKEYDVVEPEDNKDKDTGDAETTEVSVDGTTVKLQEQLYLDEDEDLDDLDDLEDE